MYFIYAWTICWIPVIQIHRRIGDKSGDNSIQEEKNLSDDMCTQQLNRIPRYYDGMRLLHWANNQIRIGAKKRTLTNS